MYLRLVIGATVLTKSLAAMASTVKAPQSDAPSVVVEESGTTKKTKSAATVNSNVVTSLGTITSDVDGDLTVVTVKLNKKPDWNDVTLEEHGTFLQIKMPKTQIPSSGEFIDGNGPYLKKIATFQLQDDDGALRFFLNMDASKAKLATSAELLGDRLVITIDHKKIEQLIAPQSTKPDAPTAAEIVAKTVVDKSQPAPSDQIKTTNESENNSTELYSRLAKAAAFCAVLFAGLIAIQLTRKARGGKSSPFRGKGESQAPAMKVISSINVGQKQKLTLVQVGNQQLLLGVGAESINLITTIGQQSNLNHNFSHALEAANPQGTVRLKSANEIIAPKPVKKSPPTQTLNTRSETTTVKSNRINVSVGDEGIMDNHLPSRNDDITKILRDRLKNLPPR
jgi:flagellar biosynthetic protein FliO